MQEITQHIRQIVPDFRGALTPLWRHGHSRELLIGCLLFMLFLSVGCKDPVIWVSECRSPDGTWIATAETVEHGGFGTAGVETVVKIRRLRGSAAPERVLAFAEGGRDMGLKMQWEGPSHLVVDYRGSPELLYFQVV